MSSATRPASISATIPTSVSSKSARAGSSWSNIWTACACRAGRSACRASIPIFSKRVEVITGPASILYGVASPGGILNLVSKRPTESPFGEVSLQTGSFDRIQGTFDVGGPVDNDKKLLYRVTGIGLNANTQVDHIGEKRFSIAPAWTWRPDIDTTITFLTSYRQDPKGGAFALLPIQGTLVPGTFGQIPRNFFAGDFNYESLKYKQATLGYEFEHRFDDVFTVRQNVRYLHNELNYVEVQPGPFTTTGACPTLRLVDGRTITRSYFSTNENLNTFAADNQLQAKFNMGPLQHTVLAGLDYQRFDFNNFARFAGLPTNTLDILAPNYTQNIAVPTAIFQNLDQRLQQRGLYVQDEAKLGRLTVLGGVRYDWAEGNTLAQNTGLRVLNDDQKRNAAALARSTISTPASRPTSATRPRSSRPASARCSMASRSSRPPANNTKLA